MYAESVTGDEPKIPLFDVNEVFIREVSADEAEQLIGTGQGEPMAEIGIKLTVARDCCWSSSCFTARDAQLIAGEYGDNEEALEARGKLANWTPPLADRIALQ